MTRDLLTRGALALGLVTLAACADEQRDPPSTTVTIPPSAPAPPPASVDSSADSVLIGDPPTLVAGPLTSPPRDWTTRTTEVARQTGVAVLRDMRTASHEGFDRVVFTFQGGLPGYHVEYVDRPAYTCGSGEALYLEGDAWLLVRMQPAQAHTDAGEPTLGERRRRLDLPVMREVALTCDFEADVSWVLGLSSPGGYQVAELDKPARLVVDVRR